MLRQRFCTVNPQCVPKQASCVPRVLYSLCRAYCAANQLCCYYATLWLHPLCACWFQHDVPACKPLEGGLRLGAIVLWYRWFHICMHVAALLPGVRAHERACTRCQAASCADHSARSASQTAAMRGHFLLHSMVGGRALPASGGPPGALQGHRHCLSESVHTACLLALSLECPLPSRDGARRSPAACPPQGCCTHTSLHAAARRSAMSNMHACVCGAARCLRVPGALLSQRGLAGMLRPCATFTFARRLACVRLCVHVQRGGQVMHACMLSACACAV